MSGARNLLSALDRAQLYTTIEIAILAAGFVGTLITQQFWVALIALATMFVFSRLVSRKLDQRIENQVESDWDDA